MTRHKKFLKSEKAKTKLKGNKLPKGLNVTKTDFKVKKIVIRDQIRENLVENGTVARSNIKDLLSKLQHHNATNRNEGIHYLKDMVTNYPQETSKHLGAIIQGICQLSMDVEKDVRQECFKAMNLVFSTQTAALIAPFFNAVTSYLRCAMTHININIQEDSLFLLDCLLSHTPLLVAQNSDSILSCFLDMISKSRNENKLERTLTLNLNRKSTNVKWRSRVLVRLSGILDAIVEGRKATFKRINDDNNQFTNTAVDDAFQLTTGQTKSIVNSKIPFNFDDVDMLNCSLVRKSLNQNCELPMVFRKSVDTVTKNVSNLMDEKDEGQKIRKYIEHLMPLLIETWIEVRPAAINANTRDEDIFITTEAALTLKNIVAIIERLLEWMEIYDNDMSNTDLVDWFRRSYCKEFVAQFLIGFPYQQSGGFKGSKRKSNGLPTDRDVHDAGGHKCEYQNLSISYIFWKLNRPSFGNELWMQKVNAFIKGLLVHIETQSPDVLQAVIKALRTILFENAEEWISKQPSITELLTSVIEIYQRGKFQKEIRTRILILLCDIVLNQALYKAFGAAVFANWLPTLPKMLCQPHISLHVLNTFSHLAKQRNKIFLENLEAIQDEIIANLARIQIIGIENQMNGKQSIVNLFYWLNTRLTESHIVQLKNTIENEWPMMERLIQIKQLNL